MQFAISTTLIIGTIIVYKQIRHAQNRPVGYNRDGLVTATVRESLHTHFEAMRTELINANVIVEMAESGSPTTEVWNTNGGFDWEGKDPEQSVDFPNNGVSYDYGKVIGWELLEGRDFSRDFGSDSSAFILNESAVAFIGLKDPVGKVIRWNGEPYTVVGVVKDLLIQSPYGPVRPAMWHLDTDAQNIFIIKLNPDMNVHDAMAKIEGVFRKTDPGTPFAPEFVDEQYAQKFGDEKRLGTLSLFFAFLAIFISCLGLFALASFVAEQRSKEIGIRKVMGASVSNLWRMLTQDFVILVLISCAISGPIAFYLISSWLGNYEYRTEVSWWVFASAIGGAILITLLTVSYQAIKASLMNPVKSLRSE